MIIYKGIVCQMLKYGARELGKASKKYWQTLHSWLYQTAKRIFKISGRTNKTRLFEILGIPIPEEIINNTHKVKRTNELDEIDALDIINFMIGTLHSKKWKGVKWGWGLRFNQNA